MTKKNVFYVKMNKKILLFFLFFIFLFLIGRRDFQTPFLLFDFAEEKEKIIENGSLIPEKIENSEILIKEKSPYLIDKNVEISKKGSLVIMSEVNVYIAPGKKIEVLGKISINGTKEEPVRLVVNHINPNENKWDGIIIKSNQENIINNAIFESASIAINTLPRSQVEIIQSTFKKNNNAVFSSGTFLKLKENIFTENKTAIFIKKSKGVISENIFDKNNLAIFLSQGNDISINNNSFLQNNNLFIQYAGTPNFYLGGNYFETQDYKKIAEKIFDKNKKKNFKYNGDIFERGLVIFEPFLKEKYIKPH